MGDDSDDNQYREINRDCYETATVGRRLRGPGEHDGESRCLARDGRRESITVSAIGVGLEYNENLMVHLANGGGGNYYYLEHSSDLASIFQKEFAVMSCVVAENCVLEFEEFRGVELVDAIGLEVIREGKRVAIPLGDLSAGEAREVVVEFAVDAGSGRRMLAEGQVRYQVEGRSGGTSEKLALRVRQTRDLAEVERERDWDVQAKAEVAQSTKRVERAMEALDAGRRDEAMQVLRDAEAALASAPAAVQSGSAGVIMKEQKSNLMNYQEVLEIREVRESSSKDVGEALARLDGGARLEAVRAWLQPELGDGSRRRRNNKTGFRLARPITLGPVFAAEPAGCCSPSACCSRPRSRGCRRRCRSRARRGWPRTGSERCRLRGAGAVRR